MLKKRKSDSLTDVGETEPRQKKYIESLSGNENQKLIKPSTSSSETLVSNPSPLYSPILDSNPSSENHGDESKDLETLFPGSSLSALPNRANEDLDESTDFTTLSEAAYVQDTLPEISDTVTNSDSVSWASVMGCFDYLIENLGECKKMFKTYTSSEIVIENNLLQLM